MEIKKAIGLCKEYGWNVTTGKYFLEWEEDRVTFNSDEELISYAEDLEKERK